MKSTLACVSLLLIAALAGCSDAPPAGDLELSPGPIKADGTATVTVVPFADPLGVAAGPDDPACTQRRLLPLPPDQQCQDPSTTIAVQFAAAGLDQPDPAAGYQVFAVGPAEGPLAVGSAMTEPGAAGWTFNNTFQADLSGQLESIELRMGDLVVASAAATAGSPNPFVPNPALAGVRAEGAYDGKDLELMVSGIPQNATAVGWLVTVDPDGGGATHEVSFPVQNGQVAYQAQREIADFQQVHIHLAGSRINIAMGPVEA